MVTWLLGKRTIHSVTRSLYIHSGSYTCGILEGLYFLSDKNNHKSLSAGKILVLCLRMTQTRLIHCSNLCSSCIGLGSLCCLASRNFFRHCASLYLFFTMGAKNFFLSAFLMQKACHKSITSFTLSKSGKFKTSTR